MRIFCGDLEGNHGQRRGSFCTGKIHRLSSIRKRDGVAGFFPPIREWSGPALTPLGGALLLIVYSFRSDREDEKSQDVASDPPPPDTPIR